MSEGSLSALGKIRPFRRLRRLAEYARVFSWPQLALFRLVDLLDGWLRRPALRRATALRRFSQIVPPERISVEGDAYRFRHELNGREISVSLRRGSSDVPVFLQVMAEHEYRPALALLSHRPTPPTIIDAGANIGLTTLYLKCFRPDARILALEPMPDNFRRLEACLRENGLEDVTPLEGGLWTEEGRLTADRGFRDGDEWSFALREGGPADQASVPVYPLHALLARAGWARVDLLKLDIEGSEAALLRDDAFLETLVDRVGLLAMEVHAEVISQEEVRGILASRGWGSVAAGQTVLAWAPGSPGSPPGGGAPA